MKNVSLLGIEVDGRKSFALLDVDGRRVASFDAFANSIIRNPVNTRMAYCRNLARFFDYFIEATRHLATKAAVPTRDDLVDVLAAYREYLVYGGHSGNRLARDVSSTLPSPMVSTASCDLMHAPVRRFIELSETLRKHLEELARHGLLTSTIDPLPLLPSVGTRPTKRFQKAALLTSSMLAGVVSGGPQLLKEAALPSVRGTSPYNEKRAFPFDAALPLIDKMPSWRDKALYSFCAASGCRISEALQLLWEDVRVAESTVKLVAPNRRANDSSYLALEPWERDKLVWKGRATQTTFLIEPFASIFFEALEKYIRFEYMPHGLHQFVFQHRRKGMEGRPFFLSAPSTRNEVFQTAVAGCILLASERKGLSVHSLRHLYGTYLLNYFPRADGSYGLPIGLVKHLMGHNSVTSTERYARHDTDLLQIELAFANTMVFGNGSIKSLNQMKRDALQAKLAAVEISILAESISPISVR
ncbi:tyrosine-type recombinase/integrase [Delftia sp. ZNC0008]|uniref:tyrosine-type recombinase/integrase n=1 Tax=Delftia sp. ZNC0008 TaxID=1339242 RepID=UPI000AB5FD7C|nr:site-specific integrase [Delftia sp. ZNC0008]